MYIEDDEAILELIAAKKDLDKSHSNCIQSHQMMIAQWIVDLVIASPPIIISGFFMMSRKAIGYVTGISLLLLLSVIFIGVVPFLIVEGTLTNNPIDAKLPISNLFI